MSSLRRLVLAHSHIAALICVVALALRLVVPSGYMVASEHGRIAITICSGTASRTVQMDMPGMHGGMADAGKPMDHEKSGGHGGAAMPCAFSSLTAQALGTVDPVFIVAAIVFVMAVGLRPVQSPVSAWTPHLRPPLRGPPTLPR